MNHGAALPAKVCTTCGNRYPVDALFCPSDGTPLKSARAGEAFESAPEAPDAYLGREISGHIEIRQLAGVGAMGRVYRAFQKGIDRDVAVKVLHRELSANAQLVARFHREAKVASRLSHPNVVQVHLAGQLPDGAMYIVMEYLDGLSLQSALAAAGGAMPITRALHIALQLCDAVGEAHAQAVVHRDMKPDNVMLVHRGGDVDYVKVLDFGIARLNWGEQSMATAAGLIFGTARYISPEGAQGEAVGPEGDVYAIATLLYQMLAGRTPFEGEQAVAVLIQQIHDAPPHLKSIPRAAYVPDAIANVIMQNLSKNPTMREADARALGRALLDAAKASGMSADDLVARPMLSSGRPSSPVQLPSMQQTKQLQLSPEVAARIAPPSSRPKLTPPRDDAQPMLSRETSKWVPPVGFDVRTRPSGVDQTMDDASDPPIVPPGRASSPSSAPRIATSTQFTPPLPEVAQRPSFVPNAASVESTLDDDDLQTRPSQVPTRRASTPPDDEEEHSPRRTRSRWFGIGVIVFLIGVFAAAVVAFKIGKLGPAALAGTHTEVVRRAHDALHQERWDAPPGDNVKDITNDGLAKWPRDPELMEIRARATDELVKEAVGRNFAGSVEDALHLARLARELDPSDTTAQHLVAEYESAALAIASAHPLPLAPVPSSSTQPSPHPSAPIVSANALRATLDADPARPRIGQTVQFVAHVINAKGQASDPHIEITMGGRTARLAANFDAGAYRSAFTFLEAGKYDVVFVATVDKVALRVARTLIAGDAPPPLTSAAPSPSDPKPAPSASVKWL